MLGEPGAPGGRGPAGPSGPKGIQGESGEVGVTFIRWGKKTCPNSGATLVYEGKFNIMQPVKSFVRIIRGFIGYHSYLLYWEARVQVLVGPLLELLK